MFLANNKAVIGVLVQRNWWSQLKNIFVFMRRHYLILTPGINNGFNKFLIQCIQ